MVGKDDPERRYTDKKLCVKVTQAGSAGVAGLLYILRHVRVPFEIELRLW